MSEEVLATAEELRQASAAYTNDTRSFHEKNTEWIQWFSKRGVRLLKDAIQFGQTSISVYIPYQPTTRDAEKGLGLLRKQVHPMLPGCAIHFIEEELEGETHCTMLIEWK